MIVTKKEQLQTEMDLVQVQGEGMQHPGRRIAFELILAAALSIGCWYTYFSMFPNPMDPLVCGILVSIIPVGLYLLCWNPFLGRFLVFYVFLLTAVFFMLAYEAVWNGLLVMANIVIESVNQQMNTGWIPFAVTGDTVDWGRDVFMAMIPVFLLASMGIAHSIYHKEPLLGFTLTGLPVLLGLCLKAEPSVWLLLLLFLSWTGLMVLSAVARNTGRRKNSPIYIHSRKNSSLPYLFLGVTLVLLVGYVLIFSGEDYRPPQSVEEAKEAVIAAEEHLRYDKLRGEETDRLTSGDLTKTHPMMYTEMPVFTLHMQMPRAMYLRGFTGGHFEDGKWSAAAEGAYSGEYAGVTEWLAQQEFYPWMQQDRLYRMSGDYDFVSVDLKNVNGSSKYMYLPYEAAMTGDTLPDKVNYKKDYGAFAKGLRGQREYTFKAFLSEFEDYNEAELAQWLAKIKKNPQWERYSEAEAVYRRYVYDTYLYVPDAEANAIGTGGAEKCAGKTIDYTLHYIRKLFDEEFQYDLEQDKAPEGRDELEYFMEDSRAGNDMHFATAAALMFRKAGIPARYAEGYYVSPDYVMLYTEMSDVTMDIPDSLAHSWVEIYIDEIGWFPVEVVPGYYDMDKHTIQEQEEDEKIQEDHNKNYEDEAPIDDQAEEKDEEEQKGIHPLILILMALLLLIAIIQCIGRYRIRRLLDSFGTVCTQAQVYAMYRYVAKVLRFDGHPLARDPYEGAKEVVQLYDAAAGGSFLEFLNLVNSVRFGGRTLFEEEHKKMARYAKALGSHIYSRQKRGKKFLMKFIFFYV